MITRLAALGASLIACLSVGLAQVPAPPAPSPPADAVEPDPVYRFDKADDATKKTILAYRKSIDLDCPDKTRWGYSDKIGKPDERKADKRYLDFDHPRVQPRPGDSTWKRYECVPNVARAKTEHDPGHDPVPKFCRPSDENWLNHKKPQTQAEAQAQAEAERCLTEPAGPFRYESLPKVEPPTTLDVTYVRTPEGIFPPLDPFAHPPGTNMLPTVYSDVSDGLGKRVENSLPSSISRRYNLHEGEPVVTPINPRSPTNDLQEVLDSVYTLLTGKSPKRLWEELDRERYEKTLAELGEPQNLRRIVANKARIRHYLEMAVSIIEGKPVADRAYSGFPLLHHSGQTRIRRVVPQLGKSGQFPAPSGPNPVDDKQPIPAIALVPNVVGGNARIHQVWYGGRIESDTMFLDWQGEYDGCRLLLLKKDARARVPKQGRDLIVVADYDDAEPLHFFLFDRDGRKIDIKPDHLKSRMNLIRTLKDKIGVEGLWDVNPTDRRHRYDVTRDVLPIVGESDLEHCYDDRCPVLVSSKIKTIDDIKANKKDLIVVSLVDDTLRVWAFDKKGKKIVEVDDRHLVARWYLVQAFRKTVANHVDKEMLTEAERLELMTGLLPILAKSPCDYAQNDLNVPPIPPNVPWTVTYTIDVLDFGSDDFATTTMFFDSQEATDAFFANQALTKGKRRRAETQQFQLRSLDDYSGKSSSKGAAPKKPHSQLPLVSMDQTFFPMRSGTRTVLTVKMPPPKYYNLTYTWGWRFHPPRAQATENVAKRKFPPVNPKEPAEPGSCGTPKAPPSSDTPPPSIVEYEREAFGDDPEQAIQKLADIAPAKRMRRSFNTVLKHLEKVTEGGAGSKEAAACLTQILDARNAFLDWKDRTHLPSGLKPDDESDLTVLFANNTTYGQLRDGGWTELTDWRTRHHPVKITLINADYFDHQYLNIEWGGNRGWEPQFKPTLPLGGSGTFFSFGRFHYQYNTPPGKITVRAAKRYKKNGDELTNSSEVPDKVVPGVHRIWLNMNHEPSRRLRFYQFDPTHHDAAIYSIH